MNTFKLLLAAISLFAFTNAQAELVTNGSLSGEIINGAVQFGQNTRSGLPAEWRSLVTKGATNNSPDTMDVNNYGGLPASIIFRATPSASPDGGTWVGIARDSSISTNEVFGQAVSGFTIGTTYQLSWFDANFGGLVTGRYDDPNFFVATLSDSATSNALETFTGTSRPVAEGWAQQSFSFIASQTNYFLTLGLGSSVNSSYMSIDGISINAVAAVPEPQTWALMAGGLLLIGFNARKRQLNS